MPLVGSGKPQPVCELGANVRLSGLGALGTKPGSNPSSATSHVSDLKEVTSPV